MLPVLMFPVLMLLTLTGRLEIGRLLMLVLPLPMLPLPGRLEIPARGGFAGRVEAIPPPPTPPGLVNDGRLPTEGRLPICARGGAVPGRLPGWTPGMAPARFAGSVDGRLNEGVPLKAPRLEIPWPPTGGRLPSVGPPVE